MPRTLVHHGIKGQRWGIRRTQAQLGHIISGKKSKASKNNKENSKDLSDEELRSRINRLNMEEQYSNLLSRQKERNTSPVRKLLANAAQNLAQKSLNLAVDKFIDKIKNPKDDFNIDEWRDADLNTMDSDIISKVSKWYKDAQSISDSKTKIENNREAAEQKAAKAKKKAEAEAAEAKKKAEAEAAEAKKKRDEATAKARAEASKAPTSTSNRNRRMDQRRRKEIEDERHERDKEHYKWIG